MPRNTDTDDITEQLINAYVIVIKNVSGWGILTAPVFQFPAGPAVFPNLLLPMQQEPYPRAHVYLAGQAHDFKQGTRIRWDTNQVNIRILGGPVSPDYQYNPELKVYSMVTAVVNELTYRPYLQDPTNSDTAFRYFAAHGRLEVGTVSRITSFNYDKLGDFAGVEIPTTVTLEINVGRVN